MKPEYDLLSISFQLLGDLTNDLAIKYLRFGFIIRTLQIKESIFLLNQLHEKSGSKNREPYETVHTNIYLNSFYINILGAIDNLSWVLHYEFEIIPGANEDNNKRNKISIFHPEFSKRLSSMDRKRTELILEYQPWYKEIKLLRDPAAHRIPLYCPPGILRPEDKEIIQAKKTNLEQTDYSKNPDAYMDNFREMSQIGRFEPIFISNTEKEDTIFSLKRTTDHDFNNFCKLSDSILTMLKINLTNA
jgi:hypothetical protein